MMASESVTLPAEWLERIAALLRGRLEPPPLHPHGRHEPLWRAMAVIAAESGRLDLPAALRVIELLTEEGRAPAAPPDGKLEAIRAELEEVGVRFLALEDDQILFAQHGKPHKGVRSRRAGEMLAEIRRNWLS
jgi:hypothetical protein